MTNAPFIGRDDELAVLTNARRNSHRYGTFVIAAGEPGIGKSRLVKQFLTDIPRGRVAVGLGRAIEHVRSPFAPWIDALASISSEAADAIRSPEAEFGSQAALHAMVVDRLRESAERRSTIVVLEDLHWADAGSIDLLHVIAARAGEIRRLMVLATVRTSEAPPSVRQLFSRGDVQLLELRPLAAAECRQLVRSLLPAKDAGTSREAQIAALSGGNPFFATELAKNGGAGEVPLTLSTAIEARIEQLDPDGVAALENAAILGELFELQLLAEITDCTPAEAAKRMEGAQRAGIVAEERGSFRFAHALTRAVLGARLTSAQRIELHKRAAQTLERRRRFDAMGFAQLAHHYAGAHERPKAYAYLMRAGGLAYALHAYTDAARFYGDAAASAESGSLDRATACARNGDALLRASALRDAEESYTEAIAIYRAADAKDEAVRLYESLARALYNQDRVRDALTTIEHAIAELEPLPTQLLDGLAMQGMMYAADLQPELGMRWMARIDEERIKATRDGGGYYTHRGAIEATMGDAEAWQRTAAAFQENVRAVEADAHYAGHFGNLASHALFLGLPAMPLYEECFALARRYRMDVYEAAFASHASFERWLHGDDDAFVRYADLAAAYDRPVPALHAYVLLAGILRTGATPDIAEIEHLIEGGRNEFFGPLTGAFARRLARSGDLRGARRALDAAADRLVRPYAAWETLTAMAELGTQPIAEKALELLLPYESSNAPAFAATCAMVRALLAQRIRDKQTRDGAAARARDLYAAMGWVRHERAAAELGAPPRQEQLFTERELQVARLLQQGHTNREIAAELFISAKTVEKYLTSLYEKLHVTNRAAAVRNLAALTLE